MSGPGAPPAGDPGDDPHEVSVLLEPLQEEPIEEPQQLVAHVLNRVRGLLTLRDLFDSLAAAPVRVLRTALNRRAGQDAPLDEGKKTRVEEGHRE